MLSFWSRLCCRCITSIILITPTFHLMVDFDFYYTLFLKQICLIYLFFSFGLKTLVFWFRLATSCLRLMPIVPLLVQRMYWYFIKKITLQGLSKASHWGVEIHTYDGSHFYYNLLVVAIIHMAAKKLTL